MKSIIGFILLLSFSHALAQDPEEFCKSKPKNETTLHCSPFKDSQKIFCPSGELYDCPPAPTYEFPATREICRPLGPSEAPRCVPDINMDPKDWCKQNHPDPGFYCHQTIKVIRIQCPQGWIYKCPQADDWKTESLNKCYQQYPTYAVCQQGGQIEQCTSQGQTFTMSLSTTQVYTQTSYVTVTPSP